MNREKVRLIVKATGVIIATVAVSATVGVALKYIIPINALTKTNKVLVVIGSGILGGVAAEAGSEYTSDMIDGIFDNVYAVYDRFNNPKGEIEEVNV